MWNIYVKSDDFSQAYFITSQNSQLFYLFPNYLSFETWSTKNRNYNATIRTFFSLLWFKKFLQCDYFVFSWTKRIKKGKRKVQHAEKLLGTSTTDTMHKTCFNNQLTGDTILACFDQNICSSTLLSSQGSRWSLRRFGGRQLSQHRRWFCDQLWHWPGKYMQTNLVLIFKRA